MSVTVYVSASSPCILPTTIRSTQCVNYSQSRRGEERRREDPQQRGSNNSDPLFPRPLWISKRNLDGQRVRFGASHGFDRIHHPTERVSYFIFILSLANANVLYVGEFLTIKEDRMANSLMDCGRGITWSVNKFERSNISLEELYNTISSDQISTTFILIFLVRTRESG